MSLLYDSILEEFCKRLEREGLPQMRALTLRVLLSANDRVRPEDLAKVLSGTEGAKPDVVE